MRWRGFFEEKHRPLRVILGEYRRLRPLLLAIALALLVPACAGRDAAIVTGPPLPTAGTSMWLVGVAHNAKLGPVVVAGGHTVHCTGRAAWPSELDGKPVVVAGTLTSRSSPPLPVGPHGERSAGAEGIAWSLSPCASPPPGGEGLLDAERALFAAFARRDRDQLERIITPDFVLRIPGEPDLDRAALVRAATTTPGDIVEVTGDRLVAHQAGTLGIVEGIQRARVRLDGKLVEGRGTFVDVFVRRDGAWHVRFALTVSDAAGDPSPRVAAGDLPSLERWRRPVPLSRCGRVAVMRQISITTDDGSGG